MKEDFAFAMRLIDADQRRDLVLVGRIKLLEVENEKLKLALSKNGLLEDSELLQASELKLAKLRD